ncbi:MAG TPA: CU044_5270 family protein [Streptosporangiaceae bacterium]|nr:CU044_5270 family protein [Streptosporangiaceae bacterium]
MDLDNLLSEADPARHTEIDDADSHRATALYRRIVGTPPSRGGGGVPTKAPRRGAAHLRMRSRGQTVQMLPRLSVTAAVAVAVVVAAAFGLVAFAGGSRAPHNTLADGVAKPSAPARSSASPRPSPTRSQPASLNQAGPVLDALAAVAAGRPPTSLVPGPGQYLYVLDIELKGAPPGGGTSMPCGSVIRQEWLASDGSGRQVGYSPGCGGNENRFAQSWKKIGNAIDFNYLAWQGLPTQPAALEAAIVQRFEGGNANNAITFLLATGVLNFTAPPAVRSALFKMLATMPGVHYLGKVTDPLGRTGDTIGLNQYAIHNHYAKHLGNIVVIFDPKTSQVLDETPMPPSRRIHLPKQMPPWLAPFMYIKTGIVNSVKATPPGTSKLLKKIPYRHWV